MTLRSWNYRKLRRFLGARCTTRLGAISIRLCIRWCNREMGWPSVDLIPQARDGMALNVQNKHVVDVVTLEQKHNLLVCFLKTQEHRGALFGTTEVTELLALC